VNADPAPPTVYAFDCHLATGRQCGSNHIVEKSAYITKCLKNGILSNLPGQPPPAKAIYRKPDFSGCGVFRLLYPLAMREEELRRYFMGEASVGQLAEDISGSVVKIDDLQSEIRVADMQGSFSLQRDHVIRLCEAFLDRALTPEALTTIRLDR
jgi:hypothetical protein